MPLPANLDFETNYEETAKHFRAVRNAVQQRRCRSIDFSGIEHISTSAALVLAAEMDVWKYKLNRRLRALTPTWRPQITRLLSEMGYFELLGLSRPKGLSTTGEPTFLKFKRGLVGEYDHGAVAKQLRIEIEELTGQPINKQRLFAGVSEAITNVAQHAYPKNERSPHKFWWVSASFHRQKKTLQVTFFDRGVSIPVTLPASKWKERLSALVLAFKDSERIEAAMELGRTSSNLPEKGKGLQNLIEFSEFHHNGRLRIYSRRGMYELSFQSEGTNPAMQSRRFDNQIPVGGTLIEWTVQL